MIARLTATALCLGAALAVALGLFWVLLNTPESNALMLGASALLVVLIAGVAATGINTAVLVAGRTTFGDALARSLRGLHWSLAAGLAGAAAWWAVLTVEAWVVTYAGEINAWFIATLDWPNIGWFFTSVTWFGRWLRWVAIPLTVFSVVAAALRAGADGHGPLRRAWHPRTLALATLVAGALILLPWQLTVWRPALPPTWIEVAAATARLGVAAVAMIVGLALFVTLVVPVTRARGTVSPVSPT